MLAITPDPTGYFTREGYDLRTIKVAAGYVPAFLQAGKNMMDCLCWHFHIKRIDGVHYTPMTNTLTIKERVFHPLAEAIDDYERLIIYGDYCVHIHKDYKEVQVCTIIPTETTMKLELKV